MPKPNPQVRLSREELELIILALINVQVSPEGRTIRKLRKALNKTRN